MSSENRHAEAELCQAQEKLCHVLASKTKWERLEQIFQKFKKNQRCIFLNDF